MTFEVLSNGNITWNLYSDDTISETGFTIEYKKNDGEWTEIAATTGGTEIPVNTGDIIQFRGDNAAYYILDDEAETESYAFFNSTCQFKAKSNIMSMINSTDFAITTTFQSVYTFINLFKNCTGLTDASNLLLPATTLAESCYSNMFRGCTSLTSAPELPAITLARGCYSGMFSGCTSLTTAPELPATTLVSSCYNNMFANTKVLPYCRNIDFASPTVVASGGLIGLFAGTKVTDNDLRQILPINPNTNNYYLPATALANRCYYGMFSGCTSLTTAPELPATTLADSCYRSMFYGCTSLTRAPELPATTLAQSCYQNMFNGCTNLNYIKCLATDVSARNCTAIWTSEVASTGTFVKNASMASWTIGYDGIPTGWNVQTATS